MTDNKDFWKIAKLFLPEKVANFSKISLVEKGEINSDESKAANSFSTFFENAICSLDIKTYQHSDGLKNRAESKYKSY